MFPPVIMIFKGMKSLATNGNFMLLAVSFALIQMVIYVTNYNLAAILFPFNYSAVSSILNKVVDVGSIGIVNNFGRNRRSVFP